MAGLPNHLKAEPTPGVSLHSFQVSVQLVSDSASSEDPMSQVTWVKPMRVFRVGLVPHTLCLLLTTPTGGVQLIFFFLSS